MKKSHKILIVIILFKCMSIRVSVLRLIRRSITSSMATSFRHVISSFDGQFLSTFGCQAQYHRFLRVSPASFQGQELHPRRPSMRSCSTDHSCCAACLHRNLSLRYCQSLHLLGTSSLLPQHPLTKQSSDRCHLHLERCRIACPC